MTNAASNLFHYHLNPHFPLPQMAHYATDCWDGEVETTYGWVECVGLADRSAYDLKAHSAMSKIDLTAFEKFPEPRMEEVVKVRGSAKRGEIRGASRGNAHIPLYPHACSPRVLTRMKDGSQQRAVHGMDDSAYPLLTAP